MRTEEAVKYLKSLDLENLEVGRYDVDEDFYYLIQEYETKPRAEAKLEAHREWIDIQYMIKGQEVIELEDISKVESITEYEPDVEFFKVPETMCKVSITDGAYMIIYPSNAHMPGVAVNDQPQKVKKCVGKVRVFC